MKDEFKSVPRLLIMLLSGPLLAALAYYVFMQYAASQIGLAAAALVEAVMREVEKVAPP